MRKKNAPHQFLHSSSSSQPLKQALFLETPDPRLAPQALSLWETAGGTMGCSCVPPIGLEAMICEKIELLNVFSSQGYCAIFIISHEQACPLKTAVYHSNLVDKI